MITLINRTILIITLLAFGFAGFAQSPQLINYQGVARNSVGNPLANQKLNLRLSVRNLSSTGAVVYSETRLVTTNGGGLYTVLIGGVGATATSGTIEATNLNYPIFLIHSWLFRPNYYQL